MLEARKKIKYEHEHPGDIRKLVQTSKKRERQKRKKKKLESA